MGDFSTQDQIMHWQGVLAGLSSDNPAWSKAQKRVTELRAKLRASADAAAALPKKPLVPASVKAQMDADLAALEKLAVDGEKA